MSKTRLYRIWNGIKARCLSPTEPAYPKYGGRGIKVCTRWLENFEAFVKDMGPCPSPKHSVDRINGNGDYEPSNCRWATSREQNNNRRDNYMVSFNGELMPIGKAVELAGYVVTTAIARDRVSRKGWTVERAISIPTTRPINSKRNGWFASPHRPDVM